MRKEFLKFLILLIVALGAAPAYSAFWQWSKTASLNAGSDPSINFAEGMSPSAVNDSARALMARAAEYRDDISGLLVTAGSSTAFTVTTNQGLNATPNDGQLLSVTMHATNGSSPTLRADGGTAYPIQSSPGAAVASGSLISGSPYSMKFSVANSAWMLKGFYSSPTNVPLGALLAYTLTFVPNSNFAIASGQCISATTYAAYWVAQGSPASGSCSGGFFRIINMSGMVPAGLDTMPGGGAAGKLTASGFGCGTAMTTVGAICANGGETSALANANLPPYTPSGTIVSTFTGQAIGTTNGSGGGGIVSSSNLAPGGGPNFTPIGTVASTFTGNAQGGSNSGFTNVQPTIGVVYIVRVL